MLPKRVTMNTIWPIEKAVLTLPVRTAAGLVATCSEVHILTKAAIAIISSNNGSPSSEKFTCPGYRTVGLYSFRTAKKIQETSSLFGPSRVMEGMLGSGRTEFLEQRQRPLERLGTAHAPSQGRLVK